MRSLIFFLLLATRIHSQTVIVSPNPFSSRTLVSFTLAQNDTVIAQVASITGQVVATIYSNTPLPAGQYTDSLILDNQPDGVYFFIFEAKRGSKKVLKLIKSLGTYVIESSDNPSVHVFPNPFKEQVYITNQEDVGLQITVTNTFGEILISQRVSEPQISLNFSEFPPGIYFLIAETDKRRSVKQIVKIE